MENIKDIFITVIFYQEKNQELNIAVGDVLRLEKEPHEKDPKAIKVLSKGQFGYIANSEGKTVLQNTESATKVGERFKETASATIIGLDHKKGPMHVYLAKLLLTETEKSKPKIDFILSGGFTAYPGKTELVADVRNSPREIKLVLINGKLCGEYKGKLSGIVKMDEETIDVLTQYTEDLPEVVAVASSVNGANIACSLTVETMVKPRMIKMQEVIDEIINNGIDTRESIGEKLEYMRRNKVSETDMVLVFKSYFLYPESVRNRISKKPKVLYVDTQGLVADSIAYMNVGKNLVFEGDKGVGKNILAETLSWLYARPRYEFSLNSQQNNNSLLGGKTFAPPTDENKKSKKVFARLISKFFFKKDKEDINETELTAIEEFLSTITSNKSQQLVYEMSAILEAFVHGGILVLDEFNTSLAHVLTVFHSLLDDRRQIEVTGYGLIEGHQNFVAIATQNKDYQGTFDANEATADRFEPIIFPPMTSLMGMLKERVPNASYDLLVVADRLYAGIKSAVELQDLPSQALTSRGFVSACEVIVNGMSPNRAFTISVANRASDNDAKQAIKNMIDSLMVD